MRRKRNVNVYERSGPSFHMKTPIHMSIVYFTYKKLCIMAAHGPKKNIIIDQVLSHYY